ncbi:MAG: alkaline phosphatase family protein [Candidatus Binataceae bacterium]
MTKLRTAALAALAFGLSAVCVPVRGSAATLEQGTIRRVLLISIDGMHAVDFGNCSKGMSGVNGGLPFCPNLAKLGGAGLTYLQASTTKPSDSFPGLTALVTGGTPRSAGLFYDVSYDRSLSPPAQTTPYGIVGGPALCPKVVGTQVGLDEEIDNDLTKLNGGGGINPNYLPRDPKNGCAPVYPHNFIRVNTIFEVVKETGGYTAWSDKHPAYEWTKGPSGQGVNDFYGPEINSTPVNMPQVKIMKCNPLPDKTAVTASDDYTTSFENIQCYDSLKVQAILNQIDGRTHDGSAAAPVPNLFGMNFQAVSVGQKLVEHGTTVGGYKDALGTPSSSLLSEIEFVDGSIGRMLNELKVRGLLNSTLIVISAKHGQSPIDPDRVLRIPADDALDTPPSAVISPAGIGAGFPVAQADEDDVSLIWLTNQKMTTSDVALLAAHEAEDGGGEILAGNALKLGFNDPAIDPRTPDIIVTPNDGVTYTGGKKKVAEHGGFANDDTHVMLVLSNPAIAPENVTLPVQTTQVAPTVLRALGLPPTALQAVVIEGTQLLPGLRFE